ncbi:MAG: hypothetical protein JWP88_1387 [Flaviaesturariibacter sp.]|nr:hypothetical protein [Flaviaesturariibacter sp.]
MKKAYLSVLAAFFSLMAMAQDAKIDVNVNKGGGSNWYSNPIVWIIGAAVFILLLVALTRGRSRD